MGRRSLEVGVVSLRVWQLQRSLFLLVLGGGG